MGIYLNPGNAAFTDIRNDVYVDKSGLIERINQSVNTPRRLSCVSRPRRFGKSFAAQMLCAYYDCSCDSSALFEDLEIAEMPSFREHLNHYNVIYVDITGAAPYTNHYKTLIPFLSENITREIMEIFPGVKKGASLPETLVNAASLNGNKFIMIVDEWDAPIRDYRGEILLVGISYNKEIEAGRRKYDCIIEPLVH